MFISWYFWHRMRDEGERYGDYYKGRDGKLYKDYAKDYLFHKEYQHYLTWHKQTGQKMYQGAESDLWWEKFWHYGKFVLPVIMGCVGAFVINPNYIRPRSYYAKRIVIAAMAYLGWTFSDYYEHKFREMFNMKMISYFPMEIRRGLESNDWRYFYIFNHKGHGNREVFDKETGYSIS